MFRQKGVRLQIFFPNTGFIADDEKIDLALFAIAMRTSQAVPASPSTRGMRAQQEDVNKPYTVKIH